MDLARPVASIDGITILSAGLPMPTNLLALDISFCGTGFCTVNAEFEEVPLYRSLYMAVSNVLLCFVLPWCYMVYLRAD